MTVDSTPRTVTDDRTAALVDGDPQIAAAVPLPDVVAAAREPGLRLPEVLVTLVEGYGDRPAIGSRARSVVTDPDTGHRSTVLRPEFETITYRELWSDVTAVASAWTQADQAPVRPGDFVATIGFASGDYLTVDLVCGYLGLVAIPLQHNAPASRLQPILAEADPVVLAVSAAYLDLAVESALGSASLRRLVVFDYSADADGDRDRLEAAAARLNAAGMDVVVETLGDTVERGRALQPTPPFTGADPDRLAMILYTSGSTGTPKGAMWTEKMVATLWTLPLKAPGAPVVNVNFMPLNHLGGRIPLSSAFQAGGTSFFVPESDLSTLFEDWSLVRPTDVGLVPRVVDMLFQRYQQSVERLVSNGVDDATADTLAKSELREHVFGGRVLGGFVSTAPLSTEMRTFIESCLEANLTDAYGLTEIGAVTTDGIIVRPLVIDYKLVDVPELGYFHTDRPYPRGELLVKSNGATPGYYKRPEVTAEVFDADGYYRTGDVMAEIAPDHLVYVDRRNNVIKLSQGEFVAVANLEAVYAGAAHVRQIFVYGNSERAALLAVVVPTDDALARFVGDPAGLKAALLQSLSRTAHEAELQSYEVPVDVLVEERPFSADDGLLSGVGKLLRPRLKERYGDALEQLYADLDDARSDELRALLEAAAHQSVVDSVMQAAQALLGISGAAPEPADRFLDLGGDSLSALTFSNLLHDVFGVETPVGVIIGPTTTLADVAAHVERERSGGSAGATFASVHGAGATVVRASDLTLQAFLPAELLSNAAELPAVSTDEPRTVLLTGANGYLGKFLALEWLERLSAVGGTLVCLVRGNDVTSARARLESVFDGGDSTLLDRFRRLAKDHLVVIVGDVAQPRFGLDQDAWQRLADQVDLVVHPAALVNHVLPYAQLFGPNVVGTAEVIRLAITARRKPVAYVSTVSVAMTVDPARFEEDGDIRTVSPERPVDDSYANGYGNSKWAGEVLLREAHDLCGLPVSVFRSGMILGHRSLAGQLNVPDMFTRLIFSVLATGLAPASFYTRDAGGHRQRAHYDGLPVDFVAEAVTTLGAETTTGFRSVDVMNPHDDGVSLDVFVDWLVDSGQAVNRIDDYDEWFRRFETALRALPERQRQQSVLPLLHAYRRPEAPVLGSLAPAEVFLAAVRDAKIGADQDVPHLTRDFADKYVSDLKLLGVLAT
ncbi:carboxylic acid reductase [Mycobacterium yunnanensis]|uniref:Carboxylic acid reductase n=1 Tax=Mycobacterium yunnanensis TaxID=368477 RepID=A0A9X3BRH0_9MYCO|nr:carboxylic acid reductase [Mycobacterium yunnanensis]MCV7419539.1 carboxylic acid reductase [Mycobacterium yunnanensis]